MFERLRQFFRSRMPGMTPEIAAVQKYRLSMFYAFITWNAFGLMIYIFMKEKFPKMNESVDYAKLLGVKNATVIRYEGFSKTDKYEIKLEDSELEKFHDKYKEDSVNQEQDGEEKKIIEYKK